MDIVPFELDVQYVSTECETKTVHGKTPRRMNPTSKSPQSKI